MEEFCYVLSTSIKMKSSVLWKGKQIQLLINQERQRLSFIKPLCWHALECVRKLFNIIKAWWEKLLSNTCLLYLGQILKISKVKWQLLQVANTESIWICLGHTGKQPDSKVYFVWLTCDNETTWQTKIRIKRYCKPTVEDSSILETKKMESRAVRICLIIWEVHESQSWGQNIQTQRDWSLEHKHFFLPLWSNMQIKYHRISQWRTANQKDVDATFETSNILTIFYSVFSVFFLTVR